MKFAYEFNAPGSKLVTIAIFLLLVTQCASQPFPGPVSRPTGYTASVDLRQNAGSLAREPKLVVRNQNFYLWLEGDTRGRCSVSVRRIFTGVPPWATSVGRLVWTANYFAGTPSGADKCTLTFTKDGDLQLWILYRQRTFMTWNSKTGGQGVTKMAFGTNPDTGDFKLLTPTNKIVYSSFNIKEFAIVRHQKFSSGELLKSPDTIQPENDANTTVFFNKGVYILALKNGDLQLLLDGPNPQVYWSLKKTLAKGKDLSKVAYAATVVETGGIGLFTASGKLVWGSEIPPPGYWADTYFAIDYDGNLKDYFMYKGVKWGVGFQAIRNDCDLPNFCGDYGLCGSNSKCSCPSKFTRVASQNTPPFCIRTGSVAKCNRKSFVQVTGYDSVFNSYAIPLKVSLASCKASCLASCECDGLFYDTKTGSCYKQSSFKTLKKVAASTKLAFIRV